MRSLLATTTLALLAGCGWGGATTIDDSEIKFALDPFTVDAGGEVFMCRYFPPSGSEAWVHEMGATLSAGAHHLLVFRIDPTLGIPADGQQRCDSQDTPPGADALLFSSQVALGGYPLPDGVAMHLSPQHGIYVQAHYINATTQPLAPTVEFFVRTMKHDDVKQLAGQFFLNDKSVDVKPGVQQSTRSCAIPADMTLLLASGHMHEHGTRFTAALDGSAIYDSDAWDSPVVREYPAPGLAATKGQVLRWTCSYDNETGADLVYGPSARANEMCIFGGVYYPAPDGWDSTWQCTGAMMP